MKRQPRTTPPADVYVLIRYPDVQRMTGLSRATIYRRIAAGDFPKSVPLSSSTARNAPVGFVLAEVKAWIVRQVALRDSE
jgi:prophage regulatory protein